MLAGLRERKRPDELEHLRAAGRHADAAARRGSPPSRSRAAASASSRSRLTVHFLESGADPYDHYIVATGAHGALPHHVTGDTPIDLAQPLLCDFGCSVAGYHSDITRVYLPEGEDGEVREALEIVRAAHDAVIAGLEPGLPAQEADKLARDVIEAAGYGDRFIHRTGHGVGLEIHEPPYLRPGNPEPLQAGHVFSVEPGIYVPGSFGVRYENLVHLGPDGPELLNAALADRDHPLDRHPRALGDRLGHLDLRRHRPQRLAQLRQRDHLHEAAARRLVGGHEVHVGAQLAQRVQHAGLGRHDRRACRARRRARSRASRPWRACARPRRRRRRRRRTP